MADHLSTLAANLRRLRETRGWSLAQLSERAGVAKATLFKIEQGRTNPTLDTLATIAATLDVDLPELLARSERPALEVVRSGEGRELIDDASVGFLVRSQVVGAGTLEVQSLRFLDGKRDMAYSHGAGSREHVLVRSGRIEVGPLGETVVLGEGDYATYPAGTPHVWEAVGGDAVLWLISTYLRPQDAS